MRGWSNVNRLMRTYECFSLSLNSGHVGRPRFKTVLKLESEDHQRADETKEAHKQENIRTGLAQVSHELRTQIITIYN